MKLWYEQPASNWNEALPLGNGHLGAMVYGDVTNEHIVLNDETIWYRGNEKDRNNPDSLNYLEEIRQLLLEEKIEEAEKLVKLSMFATPRDQSHYEFLGDLFIKQTYESDAITDYRRELDIEKSIMSISYCVADVTFKREYYVSQTDHSLIVTFSSSTSHAINFDVQLGRQKRFNDGVRKYHNNGVIMHGHAGGQKGTAFQVGCKVGSNGGDVSVIGETILCRDASEVTLVLLSATDYWENNGEELCEERLDSIDLTQEDSLRAAHVEKYQQYFNRVSLNLEDKDDLSYLPTDERLTRVKKGNKDAGLIQLYFDYGRYLLISSSQPGGLPANLQGIWSEDVDPIWGSKYTININTQMNYWLTGPCDLPELELPLFEMLNKMRENGRVTAQKMYGAKGFTSHHNTDGFYDTAPQSQAIGAAIWPLTIPWLSSHIWEHYEFTKDVSVLEKYFDIFVETLDFYEDYLFEHDGFLLTGPSVSPENKYRTNSGVEGNVCLSPTIDNQILRFFLINLIKGAKVVKDNPEGLIKRAEFILEKLPKTKVGKHGQIQEWLEDYEEVEPGHRHISPLFGLHPANEINPHETPELVDAAKVTISRRLSHGGYLPNEDREKAIGSWTKTGFVGSTRTGWSSAWLMNFLARLNDGNAALEELYGLLKNSTLTNLLDDHPPFQIDGNFGAVSGLCEMFIQSQNNVIELLPALPDDFHTGSLTGFKVRGGQKVSVNWKDNLVNKVEVKGNPFETVKIKVNSHHHVLGEEYSIEESLDENGLLKLSF